MQVSAILQRQLPVVLSQWGAPLGHPSHSPPLCSVPVGLAKSLGKPHVTFFVTNQQPWAHFNGTRASVLQFVSLHTHTQHTHTTAAKSERSGKETSTHNHNISKLLRKTKTESSRHNKTAKTAGSKQKTTHTEYTKDAHTHIEGGEQQQVNRQQHESRQ